MTEEQKNHPLFVTRKGSLSIAIFENAYGKSAVVQKSWKKRDEENWNRSSMNLFLNELPNLKEVVDEMMEKAKEDIEASQKRD